MIRVRLAAPAAMLAAAALAGSALAYVCHPAARGARMLALNGSVRSVVVDRGEVHFLLAGARGCSRVAWSTWTGRSVSVRSSCDVARRTSDAGLSVRVDSRGMPVLVTPTRSLPLPTFARGATVADGIALVEATRPDGGVFAVRLRDGAFTYLGPDGRGFAPQITARGAVFHDGEDKSALRAGKTVAMFVPRPAIERRLALTTQPLVTGGKIESLSMDGLRVALAVRDRSGRCDRVLYWNVAWRPVQRITAPYGPTCAPIGATRLAAVGVGGFRAEWLARSAQGTRLIAGSPRCQEWVVDRLGNSRLAGLAGDGATLAFATTTGRSTTVSVVGSNWRADRIGRESGRSVALAADRNNIASLSQNGIADVWTRAGRSVARLRVGASRALALDGDRLVVLRAAQLAVYDVKTGSLVRTFAVPVGASGLDLQYGVAAFSVGRAAMVVDTATGRSAVVGHASRPLVGVQIEGPGLAYAWTTARSGVARFVPWLRIEAALRS